MNGRQDGRPDSIVPTRITLAEQRPDHAGHEHHLLHRNFRLLAVERREADEGRASG